MSALVLHRYGLAFGERIVHAELDCRFEGGVVNLLYGPGGSGKSSLLKALAGWQRRLPSLRVWGMAQLGEQPLSQHEVSLVHQSLGFFVSTVGENLRASLPDRARLAVAEQWQRIRQRLEDWQASRLLDGLEQPVSCLEPGAIRLLAIVVEALRERPVLLLDEPTAGLDPAWAERIRVTIAALARERVVLAATHDARDRLEAAGPCAAYSLLPLRSDTGSAVVPIEDPGRRRGVHPLGLHARAPSGAHWVLPRRLLAMSRPGLLGELDAELDWLAQQGLNLIVCLEETQTVAPQRLPAGIEALHFPIRDMRVPEDPAGFASLVEQLIAQLRRPGLRIAVHCKAGLGRTGMLCACLLGRLEGLDATEAILRLRRLDVRFVQTVDQAEFVAGYLASRAGRALQPH